MADFKKVLFRFFLILQVLLLSGMGSLPNQKPEKCVLCNRDIDSRMETILTLENGGEKKVCCIKCAFGYESENPKKVSAIKVTDFATGEKLKPEGAFYLYGSDFAPYCSKKVMFDQAKIPFVLCYDRCLPSVIAFKTEQGAKIFMKEHGGRILTLVELRNVEK